MERWLSVRKFNVGFLQWIKDRTTFYISEDAIGGYRVMLLSQPLIEATFDMCTCEECFKWDMGRLAFWQNYRLAWFLSCREERFWFLRETFLLALRDSPLFNYNRFNPFIAFPKEKEIKSIVI